MSRTLHQIPTEMFRVRITKMFDSGYEHTDDLGPYLSIGTAEACVTRELAFHAAFQDTPARANIFRYALPGEWEVVK